MKFLVRKAKIEDAAEIGHVHMAAWKVTYKGIIEQSFLDSLEIEKRIESAKNRILNENIDNFVAIEESTNKILGFCDVGSCREKNVDADGELYTIYLDPQVKRMGIGHQLFSAGMLCLKNKNYKKMMISTFKENHPSRKFYEKMGGQEIGNDQVIIQNISYPTTTYIWKL